ncbi:MAG: hypothetical protein QXM46_02475 [Candidatus Hadarchaeales archaeon]
MRGFFPLAASGLLLLLLSLTLSLQAVKLEHARSSLSLHETSLQELVLSGVNTRNDLRDLCRHATYQALWEVGRRASSYRTGEERREAVENLARDLFSTLLPLLPSLYSEVDGRLLFLPGGKVGFHLSPLENGFCLLRVEMPGSSLHVTSPDRSSSLLLSLEELEVFIDSRFFLLQERMDLFLKRLGEVGREWRNVQYLQAWGQALSARKVELSPSFAKESLLAAWSAQELGTFGSFDYTSFLPRSLPSPPPDRREVLDLLWSLKERTERLQRGLEEEATRWRENLPPSPVLETLERTVKELEGLEEEYQKLSSLAESSGDPLVGMLSRSNLEGSHPSFLLRLRWNLSGVRHLLLSLEERTRGGENSASLASSLDGLLSLPPPLRELDGVPVCVEGENQGNLASLRLLLGKALEEFGGLAEIPEPFPPMGELPSFALPIRREDLLLFPPPPLREDPGLSVLRELEVKEVRFRREDPSGLLGLPSATPLVLPFLGVRVWWAQWRTEVVLEREPVEEILDYRYPSLLLPCLSSRVPLAYRFEIPRRKFETRVVVFSPWLFSVSS